ncbi:MAG: hypothetical protein FJ294_11275 [Planctomycetes bacterium]|nr:hypothetical protein [Planctomycetota bacterium]
MSWFEELFGFEERGWSDTRSRFVVEGERLRALANGKSWQVGTLETPSLGELRARAPATLGKLRVENISADAHRLHAEHEVRGALVQVASQFNLLEMVHYDISPEEGITRYASDRTQGPACALAAAPATVVRNYFAPVAGESGQTRERQLDMLAELAASLPAGERIRMRNGYALLDAATLATIDAALAAANETQLDAWRAKLRIGLHWNIEVTATGPARGQLVSQAFCSALPVSYNRSASGPAWARFATLVLEAAYEATLLAALANAQRGGSARVYLTLLGGGAFGNSRDWILQAIRRALDLHRDRELHVTFVSYGSIPADLRALADKYR